MHAGPSNQKRDLRQLAALAKQLDAGLVLTGLFRHYMVRAEHTMPHIASRALQSHPRALQRANLIYTRQGLPSGPSTGLR